MYFVAKLKFAVRVNPQDLSLATAYCSVDCELDETDKKSHRNIGST